MEVVVLFSFLHKMEGDGYNGSSEKLHGGESFGT